MCTACIHVHTCICFYIHVLIVTDLLLLSPAYSGSLRKRYDALQCSVVEFKGLVDEAVNRRAEFDATLDGMLERLDEIERKCAETEEQPLRVQERAEAVRVSQLGVNRLNTV